MSSDNPVNHDRPDFPGRREFIRSLSAASLGLIAGGGAVFVAPKQAAGAPAPVLDPQEPLRVGMVGTQGHTDVVLSPLGKIPGATIAAYAFEDGEWEYNTDGTRRGGAYNMDARVRWAKNQPWFNSQTRLYETYQEMFAKQKLDVVGVCLPYVRNAYAAAAAAAGGAHIMCEKPVAVNFADLDMLEKAVSRAGVRLSAMFPIRTTPTIAAIAEGVKKGLIGKVCMAKAQKSYQFGQERPWFYKVREIYGGTIPWVAIHAIDFLRWSTGLEVRKVGAFQGNLAHPDYPGCEDHGVIMMELEGGASASVTMDYLRPEKAPTHGDDRLRVIGSKGVMETRDLDTRVELITNDQGPADIPLPNPDPLFVDFVASLRGQREHIIGPHEAVRVTRIALTARQAADQGRILEV